MRLGSLLVRTDANSQIGAGHFMRCLALAQTWQEQGGTAIFLMAPGASTLGKRLENENIREIRLSAQAASSADAEETAEIALQNSVAWVALDGYQFSPDYQRRLKDKIAHLLLFDDLADAERYYADLLLNQNAYATPEMYANRAGNCTLLLGATYLLLRREFQEWRGHNRQIPQRARNLLVTFGGSDAENGTTDALQALALLPAPAMNVRVVVGASNPHRAALERVAAELDHSVEFQTDSKRIAEEMNWADVAMSAAGSTSWELAFMGLPSLLITLSENQRGCAQYLDRQGIAISLGWQHQVQPAEAATALSALAADCARRAEMSSRGRALIDGRGAQRVVQTMAGITSGEVRGILR
jgi:UDP-2,4-diacetamido-2,4,6-trideoxy-beta-L-altropyranose hydrolase